VSIKQFCEQFDRVYCISLSRSTDRRDYIARYFRDIGIQRYEFFDATDRSDEIVGRYYADGLVKTEPPCFRCGKLSCGRDDCNNVLIAPQVATFISYLRLWKKIVDDGVGRALIVEDDVIFTDYAAETASAVVQARILDNIGFIPDRPVIMRLGWALSEEHHASTTPVAEKGQVRMSNPCHAITRAFAERLLQRFERVETTVDIYQHDIVGKTVDNYTLQPPLSYELSWSVGAVDSLIHPKEIRVSYLREHHAEDISAIEAAAHKVLMHRAHRTLGTEARSSDEALLIGGCPRSGTTILQYVLNTDPGVYISNEMNLFKIVNTLQDMLGEDAVLAAKKSGEIPRAMSEREKWTVDDFRKFKFSAVHTWDVLKKIYEVHHAAVRPGQLLRLIGDKLPKYFQQLAAGKLADRPFKYIHITRNPIDVINSMIMRVRNAQAGNDTWKAHATSESQISIWQEAFGFIRRRESDTNILHVLYEDFVFDTDRVMREICDFLGLEIDWTHVVENDREKHFRRENIGDEVLRAVDDSGIYREYTDYLRDRYPFSQAMQVALEAQSLFDSLRERSLVTTCDGEPSEMEVADRLTRMGESLFTSGDLAGAKQAFLDALDAAPRFVTAHNNLGVLSWHEGDSDGAVRHFMAALELCPSDSVALVNLVDVLKECGVSPETVSGLERQLAAMRLAAAPEDVETFARITCQSPHERDAADYDDRITMGTMLDMQSKQLARSELPDFASILASCNGFLQDRAADRVARNHAFLDILLGGRPPLDPTDDGCVEMADCFGVLGVKPDRAKSQVISFAERRGKPVYVFENGFIRSVHTWVDGVHGPHLTSGISYVFDDATAYYDATRPSRLEWLLQNAALPDQASIARARRNIGFIQDNHLTKYNHQPIASFKPKRKSNHNILVIDQSYNDYSVLLGGADESSFARMLDEAVNANPGADIYVKVHPDSLAGSRDGRHGYFDEYAGHPRVTFIAEPINPITLIEPFDEIHVVTSQFGLEALMQGKRVVCHGLPFYSGWGLTVDRLKCSRRTRVLSREALFHYVYQIYTIYVNPETGHLASLEEAMDWLLMRRNEFFKHGH
jgi:GR25 family glycosyltransferase involved in LPS biosynthesis/tetratricopeptide (TPR) repeat protein